MKLTSRARFSTICLHAGQEPDPSTGAIITPIYQTSTYVQEALGRHKGYEYARTQNPTRMALERNLAAIESGKEGFAFASGMAAIGAIATMLKSGDHVVVSDNTYGGTFRLFDKVLRRYQLSFTYVDTSDLDQVEGAMTPATKMLFVETPTNPVMRLTDLRAAADLAHAQAFFSGTDAWVIVAGCEISDSTPPRLSASEWSLTPFSMRRAASSEPSSNASMPPKPRICFFASS